MNKQDFIKRLNEFYNEFDIKPSDCFVSHGGSMVMLELSPTTNDIDLTVSNEVYNRFKNDSKYSVTPIPALGRLSAWECIKVNDYIDIHPVRGGIIDETVLFEENNVRFRNMKATLEDYLAFNRPKDQPRIRQLFRHVKIVDAKKMDELQLRAAMDVNHNYGSLAGGADKPYDPPSHFILGKPKK